METFGSRAEDGGLVLTFLAKAIPGTYTFVIQRLPWQVPGVMLIVLGLDGPVPVYRVTVKKRV